MPRVFISSIIKGYEGIRDEISRKIVDDFGWEVWCSGVIDPHTGGHPSLSVCLERVEWADLYIGIFGKKYGTLIDPPRLSFTELEYQRAVARRKYTYIYIENYDPLPIDKLVFADEDEVRLQCFIEFVKGDPHIGKYARFFNADKLKSLYQDKIRSDLEDFGTKWISNTLKKPSLYIMKITSDLQKIQNDLYGLINIWKLQPIPGKFDEKFVRDKLEEMNLLYDQNAFCDTLETGLDVLKQLKKVPPLKYKKYRRVWARFLEKWVNTYAEIGNWGTFGPIPATKAVIQIYQSLEDFQNMYGTANSMASLHYSNRDFERALICSNLAKSVEGPRPREVSKSSVRGRIFLKIGNFKGAERCFWYCVTANEKFGFSEASYGLHLSGLGLTEIALGKDKDGMRKLEKGRSICQAQNNPGFTVRTKIAIAEHYIKRGMMSEAREEVEEAYRTAKEHKLSLLDRVIPLAISLNIDISSLK